MNPLCVLVLIGMTTCYQTPATKSHSVPFYTKNGLAYVLVVVNHKPLTLVVDTGSTLTVISDKKLSQAQRGSSVTIRTAHSEYQAYTVSFTWTLDSHDYQIPTGLLGFIQVPDADGVLGQDALRLFRSVTFDYANSTVILEER